MIAEKLAMDARPDQRPSVIDVHLGHAELGGGEIFVLVNAARLGIERAARRVDALHFRLRHAGAAVHDDGKPGIFCLIASSTSKWSDCWPLNL